MKKQRINKDAIFAAINAIYLQSEGKVPNPAFYTTIKKELSVLTKYTKLPCEEAYIFAIIFYVNLMGESSNLNDLSKYFQTNTFSLLSIVDKPLRDTRLPRRLRKPASYISLPRV